MRFTIIYTVLLIFLKEHLCSNYVAKYLDVPLDHFSFTTNATFKLKYLVNDTYYMQGSAPIFFYTGNEALVEMFANNTGIIFDLAPKFNALIIFAEHRFYGESLPFGNQSYASPTNLGYLSAAQALADYVYLINDLQTTYSVNDHKIPVIAFGGSYGGMLAAWLRMKYPYSVLGSIASSAPILQFKDLTPCGNFYKIASDVFKNLGSEECSETISKSWKALRTKTADDNGKAEVSKMFNLCKVLKSSDNVETFKNWLEEIYINLVMLNYPYSTSFLTPLPANPVRAYCSKINTSNYDDDNELLKAIANALTVYTNYTGTTECNDIGQTSSNLGESGWGFQSCTDMIMPMCSTDDDIFENSDWDFKKYSDDCFKRYSVRPRSEQVPILEYGGKDISSASNIVFSNGLLDPWSSGGVITNVSSSVQAILLPDGAHHFDLRGENPLDSDSVKTARKFHENQIRIWLEEYFHTVYNQISVDAI